MGMICDILDKTTRENSISRLARHQTRKKKKERSEISSMIKEIYYIFNKEILEFLGNGKPIGCVFKRVTNFGMSGFQMG